MTSPSRRARLRLAAVVSLGVLATGLAACSEEVVPERDQAPAGETTSPSPGDETSPASEEPQPSASGPDAETDDVTVPLYFVADTGRGPKLFREFRSLPSDNPLEEAAAMIVAGDTLDPDYRTMWPPLEIDRVYNADPVIVVEITNDGFTERPDGMSRRDARLAIQQLVFTLQGIEQERLPVLFKRTNSDQRIFGLPSDVEYSNAKQLNVSGLVNVTSPEQGSTHTGDTLEASGVASSFEATVPWEIRRGDEVVLDGFTTAEGWIDKLHPWEASIDITGLEPGDYTFVARTDDPSGGAEGVGPDEDTKDFTIE